MDRTKEIEQSIIKKYRKQIWRKFVKGVQTYDMIQPNDKIAVCISGGKDSMLMAKLLQELKRHGKFDFELVFYLWILDIMKKIERKLKRMQKF